MLHSPIHEERALALLILVDAFERGDEATARTNLRALPGEHQRSSTTGISSTVRRGQIVGGWLRESQQGTADEAGEARSRYGSGELR